MSTLKLKSAIRNRYSGDAWALFFEVPDGTGMAKLRTADAIAMSLYPSRGLLLHGHELKASRSDWLKELRTPEKAESICRFCDHWWIVAADKDIVKPDELPPTWGLMVLESRGLVATVKAPKLEPAPIDRAFLAGLLRAATKETARATAAELRVARNAGYDEGLKAGNGSYEKECLDKLTEHVRRFQEATGISISQYGFRCDDADLVKDVVAARGVKHRLEQEIQEIERCAKRIMSAAARRKPQ